MHQILSICRIVTFPTNMDNLKSIKVVNKPIAIYYDIINISKWRRSIVEDVSKNERVRLDPNPSPSHLMSILKCALERFGFHGDSAPFIVGISTRIRICSKGNTSSAVKSIIKTINVDDASVKRRCSQGLVIKATNPFPLRQIVDFSTKSTSFTPDS